MSRPFPRPVAIAIAAITMVATWTAFAQDAPPAAPAPVKTVKPSNAAAKAADSDKKKGTAADRLDLDKTVVTGNRELPKVLYIVPWKKSEMGDLPAQPFNTLLDEALTPVDRDVFKRELSYYDALQGAGDGKPAAPQSQVEK